MKDVIRELYWTIKTKSMAPSMSLFEYFCWRIVRVRNLLNK